MIDIIILGLLLVMLGLTVYQVILAKSIQRDIEDSHQIKDRLKQIKDSKF